MKKVIAGSRASRLAVIQTELVTGYIGENFPDFQAEILTMTTTGDRILKRTLDQVGGKGLFAVSYNHLFNVIRAKGHAQEQ